MKVAQPELSRARGGRHRDPSRDDALRQATLELLGEVGYERLTVDAVAARVRAGKATVYRRWPSKAELVVDAVTHRKEPVASPDTGSLRGDLLAMTRGPKGETDPLSDARLLAGLVSALLHDAEFRTAFERAGQPADAMLEAVFSRAVARGEIAPPANLELIASIVPALAVYRLVTAGELPDAAFFTSVIDDLILPLVADQPGQRPVRT
jgi:AcrR family transcriptional regulator